MSINEKRASQKQHSGGSALSLTSQRVLQGVQDQHLEYWSASGLSAGTASLLHLHDITRI